MPRSLFVALLISFLSVSASAQQSNSQLAIPSPSPFRQSEYSDFNPGHFLLRPPRIIPDLSYPPQFVQLPLPSYTGTLINIKEPQFRVINGTVYISILDQSIYFPMAGGGASGCLTLDPPRLHMTTIKPIRTVERK
jgi:hypothetical protein